VEKLNKPEAKSQTQLVASKIFPEKRQKTKKLQYYKLQSLIWELGKANREVVVLCLP
jgi:hypothetical protein